ncbi:MAG: hypothetical protein AB7U34_02575 [Novosphingobium sp.]
MGEQWVSASKALEIVGDPVALCKRLNAGLVFALAERFLVNGEVQKQPLVPKEFWWAQGHAALEQDWEAGDFSTWIDKRNCLEAFGVTFALSPVLELVPFEDRAGIRLSLSVAGNKDWMTAREALFFAAEQWRLQDPVKRILNQARLGFMAGRAVRAKVRTATPPGFEETKIDQREWNIPSWFWDATNNPNNGTWDWESGSFNGLFITPHGVATVALDGVHFLKKDIEARFARETEPQAESGETNRGRKPKYDWDAATDAIWGRLLHGELIPENQADVERALQSELRVGDFEPGESTVRPYANRIWLQFSRP